MARAHGRRGVSIHQHDTRATGGTTLSPDELDITPFATGVVSVPSGGTVSVDKDQAYSSDFWDVALHVRSDNGQRVTKSLKRVSSDNGEWILEDVGGGGGDYGFATIEYSTG